ncbi:MAG: hypothetical protein WCI18_02225 [Pseudomonadota bacterium]
MSNSQLKNPIAQKFMLYLRFLSTALLFFGTWGPRAHGDTIDGKLGLEQTQVISTVYLGKVLTTPEASLTYGKEFVDRWTLFAEYQTNSKNTLSAGVFGISYDSEDLRAKGGAIYNDGSAEIVKAPIWVFRTSFGIGLFKYVDILKSSNPALGKLNNVPVQADMYGLKFSATGLYFLNPNYAISGSFSYSVASASSFGISSSAASLGLLYVSLH